MNTITIMTTITRMGTVAATIIMERKNMPAMSMKGTVITMMGTVDVTITMTGIAAAAIIMTMTTMRTRYLPAGVWRRRSPTVRMK